MNRPGGLTALAVFNFIIAGWSALQILGLAIILGGGARGEGPLPPEFLLQLSLVYLIIDVGLLIVAGIGYLKLKRVMGRFLGSGEAVLGLIYLAVLVSYTQSEGVPFAFSNLTHLVYPALTLVLLNVVFRENLDR